MSNLKQLREQFDKVIIKYSERSCEVMLVKGLSLYVGRSQCHSGDSFNRKLGRTIALGRAEYIAKVSRGEENRRQDFIGAEFAKGYYVITHDEIQLDRVIQEFLPNKKSQEAS